MIPKLFLICAILVLSVPASAGVTPYEVVLRIPYGSEAGELDTLKVRSDDPFRSLVTAFSVEPEGRVWLLPLVGVAGRMVLFCYEDGVFSHELPFTGHPMGFLLTEEGVYSWMSVGRRREIAALIAFDPGPGKGEVRRAELLAGDESGPVHFGGWMGLVDGLPYLFGSREGRLFTVPLEKGLPNLHLSDSDVVWGLRSSRGFPDPIWQDTKLIRRGDEVLYDIGLVDGTLAVTLPGGGFVISRPGDKDGEKFNNRFQIHDSSGSLVRTVVTLPHRDKFGVSRSPWFFDDDHCYQLLLGEEEGRLLRY